MSDLEFDSTQVRYTAESLSDVQDVLNQISSFQDPALPMGALFGSGGLAMQAQAVLLERAFDAHQFAAAAAAHASELSVILADAALRFDCLEGS
ncbi:hypothetical protein EH165_08315 [Nakamurella antarctica]|uniref:Uncharacterized protein n=1 Tax=Nakamurella antarctica TaxID=1902245 RepID=A0A3G8ZLD6_9ACTN|nr:hypothetical protein [Nakamurella antarctica]AZI58142.1 hypothetical protein EH165_08315 [Nakamurella antarctica]